jgi:hypothetical protein
MSRCFSLLRRRRRQLRRGPPRRHSCQGGPDLLCASLGVARPHGHRRAAEVRLQLGPSCGARRWTHEARRLASTAATAARSPSARRPCRCREERQCCRGSQMPKSVDGGPSCRNPSAWGSRRRRLALLRLSTALPPPQPPQWQWRTQGLSWAPAAAELRAGAAALLLTCRSGRRRAAPAPQRPARLHPRWRHTQPQPGGRPRRLVFRCEGGVVSLEV